MGQSWAHGMQSCISTEAHPTDMCGLLLSAALYLAGSATCVDVAHHCSRGSPGSGTRWKVSGKHNCIFLSYFGKSECMQPQIICMGVSASLCYCKILSAILEGVAFILLTNPFLLRALQPFCMQVLAACPCSRSCCSRAGAEMCSCPSLHPPML